VDESILTNTRQKIRAPEGALILYNKVVSGVNYLTSNATVSLEPKDTDAGSVTTV